jgi:hypothetical protein
LGHKEAQGTARVDAAKMENDEDLGKLFSLSEKEFGEGYRDKLFEQYRIYLETIDKLSERRAASNAFFLSISTGLLAVLGILFNATGTESTNSELLLIGSIGGIIFNYSWSRIVKSYRQLNRGKWQIVNTIEKRLPLMLHETEWKILGEGKNSSLYKPLTDTERTVPIVFMGIFSALIIYSIALRILLIL